MKKIVIGGFPCTKFSIAQTKDREVLPYSGEGWELFLNCVYALEKIQPDYFMFENNHSMAKAIRAAIEELLGVPAQMLNSASVSAQTRKRLYLCNWPVPQPEDRGILLRDILESGTPLTTAQNGKSFCITATEWKGSTLHNTLRKHRRTLVAEPAGNATPKRVYTVKGGVIVADEEEFRVNLPDGEYTMRKLTPIECERLQTLPDNYTAGVSNTQRYRQLGNGWTAEIIKHIFTHGFGHLPRDEKLVVYAFYDGISVGRHVLHEMGFTNVEYHAWEIDKYAIQTSKKNYPDIIHHGDAFAVREDNWEFAPGVKVQIQRPRVEMVEQQRFY